MNRPRRSIIVLCLLVFVAGCGGEPKNQGRADLDVTPGPYYPAEWAGVSELMVGVPPFYRSLYVVHGSFPNDEGCDPFWSRLDPRRVKVVVSEQDSAVVIAASAPVSKTLPQRGNECILMQTWSSWSRLIGLHRPLGDRQLYDAACGMRQSISPSEGNLPEGHNMTRLSPWMGRFSTGRNPRPCSES
jgi:hypothetical protein